MSLTRSVGRNSLIQLVGKIVGTVFGVITVALIQRYLAPEGFGAYTVAMAYLGIFSVVADLGLYLILVRELAKPNADEQKIVGNLLALRWTSALIILGLGALGVWLWPGLDHEVKMAVIVGAGSFIAIAGTQLLVGIFQTKLAMIYVTTAELVGRVILLALSWWAVQADGGLLAVMGAVVGGSLINFVLVVSTARKFVPIRLQFDFSYWKHTLRQTLPIAISIVLNLIYFRAGTIILAHYHSQYDVGLYGAAYKILEILITFDLILIGLLLPMLGAAFAQNDHDRFRSIFQKGFDWLLIAVAPLLVGGWILAKQVLVAIGQEQYAPAAPILQLLLIAVAALFLNGLSSHSVTIINRQRQMVWSYLSVAVVGLAVYLWLIPRYSYYGAAIGTILTEVATAVVGYILVLRVMHIRLSLKIVPKLVIAAGAMGLVLYLLRDLNFWVLLVLGGATYGVLLIVTKALTIGSMREILASRSTKVDTANSVPIVPE